MAVILVVDDEIGIRELLSEILSDEGYGVLLAENASAARSAMTQHPDLVLLDIWMPDNDGVSLLKEWNATGQLNVPVIMMSGHATLDTAVEATKFGAVDFLEKPIALSRLISSVKEALAKSPREPKIGTAARPQYNRVEPAPIRSATQAPIPAAPAPLHSQDKSGSASSSQLLDQVDFCAPLREARDQFERIYFLNLLKRENNSITRVASFAGLERTHLYRKLKQLGIEVGKIGKAKE
ncbi:response regulator [uncultured Parasutterella sp.]|jgi:DNA-binding NtrC family response regulator|uniref:response regulator n=1 Tax=uncultured Parasutterella sp. TaxID=1263098 RepID=UPI0025F44344|nr:response regulator [uncultured Parasutterella sp.]